MLETRLNGGRVIVEPIACWLIWDDGEVEAMLPDPGGQMANVTDMDPDDVRLYHPDAIGTENWSLREERVAG